MSPSQEAGNLKIEATSYFDISPKRHASLVSRPAVSPADVSPGTQPPLPASAPARRPLFRFHSDFEALHRRLHGHTIDENESREFPISTSNSSPPSAGTPSTRITPGRSVANTPRRPSMQSSDSSAHSSVTPGRNFSKEIQTYPPRRPKATQIWGGSLPLTFKREKRNASAENTRRRSSTLSESVTGGGDVIIVRRDLTPLRPPQSKTVPVSDEVKSSSIKVESDFTEVAKVKDVPEKTQSVEAMLHGKTRSSEQSAHQKVYTPEPRSRPSSRRSSINPKHIFSAPLQLLRRVSIPKRSNSAAGKQPSPSPERRHTRMPDHITQLRRNYTSDALHRVTAALQEMKQNSPATLFPPSIVRPLTWKSWSDKSIPLKFKKEPKTTQGIISELANNNHGSSPETPGSDVRSYTSSERNRRLGSVPTNTPDENATYKIKRSPSAETEEFLKVDISIRGGTSYLPSEARRIHTPPLPEEGADGRWKGFFFDYNAPRRASSMQTSEIVIEVVPESGPASPDSGQSSHFEPGKLIPDGRSKLERSKSKNKRILTGDWIDVKLAEIDSMGNRPSEDDNNAGKAGTRRLNSPDVLSKGRTRIIYEGKEVEPDMFDLTIPEHLPSSPLCPRHPRYWRVVRGKGSQFRGC
ncbi:hypothetical protein H2200_006182 [Cladophialophora chaetospira]|uniref:Uncharacterized protein n=1 Tax=Cladophialophora chaetospira TaxID=386627 RepID=A0AA39CIA2_9EURO|nr:hypothetical protein H2200_006182 [Cladophialophora chaetospira]